MVLAEPGLTPAQRLHKMYLTALGRPPTAAETQQMLAFLQGQAKFYGPPNDPRPWAKHYAIGERRQSR